MKRNGREPVCRHRPRRCHHPHLSIHLSTVCHPRQQSPRQSEDTRDPPPCSSPLSDHPPTPPSSRPYLPCPLPSPPSCRVGSGSVHPPPRATRSGTSPRTRTSAISRLSHRPFQKKKRGGRKAMGPRPEE